MESFTLTPKLNTFSENYSFLRYNVKCDEQAALVINTNEMLTILFIVFNTPFFFWVGDSNESYCAVLFCNIAYYAVRGGSHF